MRFERAYIWSRHGDLTSTHLQYQQVKQGECMCSILYYSSPEQVLSVSQALVVVLRIDDVMRWLQMAIMSPCISVQGWMWVLAGTAPGGGQQQQQMMMMPEEEEAWRLRSYRWSSMTLQEPK